MFLFSTSTDAWPFVGGPEYTIPNDDWSTSGLPDG